MIMFYEEGAHLVKITHIFSIFLGSLALLDYSYVIKHIFVAINYVGESIGNGSR